MKLTLYPLTVLAVFAIGISSCNTVKYLAPGDRLYNKPVIKLVNPDQVNDDNLVKENLAELAEPKANNKFLGLFRIKLWLHYRVKEPKKKKGLRYWLKYKIGKPPVFYNPADSRQSASVMQKYMEDNGYFRTRVTYDTVVHNHQVNVIYSVLSQGQYFINSISFPRDTSEASRIIQNDSSGMLTRPRQAYSFDKLVAERDRLGNQIRDKGFYDFSKDYIYYYVDTTIGNHKLDLYFLVKPPTDSTVHKKYFLQDVTAYTTSAYEDVDTATALSNDTTLYKGVYIIQPEVFLRNNPLVTSIFLKTGDHYSTKRQSSTLSHLLNLNVYSFVNIKFRKVSNDSLKANLYLTPSKTQTFTAEQNISTTTTNFLGTGVSLSYANRNIFKGAELLTLSTAASVETQAGIVHESFINTLDLTAKAQLGFPRFIVPFPVNYYRLPFIPRTNLELAEDYQQRILFYTVNSFTASINYDWRSTAQQRHIVTPLSVNSIRLFSTTDSFNTILNEDPVLRTSFENIFIISTKYSYIYNGKKPEFQRHYFYFRGDGSVAGNIIYLFEKALKPNEQTPYNIFGRPFAQFSKFQLDGRSYYNINKLHSFVTRFLVGAIVPYGNSTVSPYLEQFFEGGANGVRAYNVRTLGPGGYANLTENSQFPDQTGDIKLEMNAELRLTVYKFLKWAFFTDAGNVWLARPDSTRPLANFALNRFYKEIAIGVGTGVRLDFNFFVIRFDVSFPLRKPELPEDERWVIDQIDPISKNWLNSNLVYNIAIGYPF